MNDKTNALPVWLTASEDRPDRFYVDAPRAYCWALELLQGQPGAPALLVKDGGPTPACDRYWLEVAYHFVRWEARLRLALAGYRAPPGGASMFIMKAGDEKAVWAQRNAPLCKYDPLSNDPQTGWRAVLREAVALWTSVRGLPIPEA